MTFEKYKPSEALFKINPSLYLAKSWAIRFKELNINDNNLTPNVLQEKRMIADKVLIFSNNAKLTDNEKEIESKRWIEKHKRMREFGGKLTVEQRQEFSSDYFYLIDALCDKLFLIKE